MQRADLGCTNAGLPCARPPLHRHVAELKKHGWKPGASMVAQKTRNVHNPTGQINFFFLCKVWRRNRSLFSLQQQRPRAGRSIHGTPSHLCRTYAKRAKRTQYRSYTDMIEGRHGRGALVQPHRTGVHQPATRTRSARAHTLHNVLHPKRCVHFPIPKHVLQQKDNGSGQNRETDTEGGRHS